MTYTFINNWLEHFQIKTEPNPFIFLYTFIIITVLMIIVTGYQSYKLITVSPTEILRQD